MHYPRSFLDIKILKGSRRKKKHSKQSKEVKGIPSFLYLMDLELLVQACLVPFMPWLEMRRQSQMQPLNLSDPRLTDYDTLRKNINDLKARRPAEVPIYDFKSSSRIGFRCHQIGKSSLDSYCNTCRSSTNLAMFLDCNNTFCDRSPERTHNWTPLSWTILLP